MVDINSTENEAGFGFDLDRLTAAVITHGKDRVEMDASIKRLKAAVAKLDTNTEDAGMIGKVLRENLTDDELGKLAGHVFDIAEKNLKKLEK